MTLRLSILFIFYLIPLLIFIQFFQKLNFLFFILLYLIIYSNLLNFN